MNKEYRSYARFILLIILLVVSLPSLVQAANETVITSFHAPVTQISVSVGTKRSDVRLPAVLEAQTVDDNTVEVEVMWDDDGLYNSNIPGEYVFKANIIDIESYAYEQEFPVAIVMVMTTEDEEAFIEVPEVSEVPDVSEIPEVIEVPEGVKVPEIEPRSLYSIPVIPAPLHNNPIVIINESALVQVGYDTLYAAMTYIDNNANNYTIVFTQDYTLNAADVLFIKQHGSRASSITFTGLYHNGSNYVKSKLFINSVELQFATNTTFRDIVLYAGASNAAVIFDAMANQLTMEDGVTCNGFQSIKIFGGYAQSGLSNPKVTIKSGTWSEVSYVNKVVLNQNLGEIMITITGTAQVGAINPGAVPVVAKVVLNIDGSQGAKVTGRLESGGYSNAITLNWKNFTYDNTIFGSLSIGGMNSGTVVLNVEGECDIPYQNIIVRSEVNLLPDSKLHLGSMLYSESAVLSFASNSVLELTGTREHRINNIDVKGSGAQLLISSNNSNPLKLRGAYIGTEQLFLGTPEGPVQDGKIFLSFIITPSNAVAKNYTVNPQGYVEKSNSDIIYREKREVTVSISKRVVGDYGDRTKEFSFTIYFVTVEGIGLPEGLQIPYEGSVLAGTGASAPADGVVTVGRDGQTEVVLRHGQQVTFSGIGINEKIRIIEAQDVNYIPSFRDSVNVEATDSADTGLVTLSGDRIFEFINTRFYVVPTGIAVGPGSDVVLLGIAVVLLIILCAGRWCCRKGGM